MSDGEPELGLGLVVDVDARRVQILFPASGEVRIYARDQAPLRRVRFAPGDRIEDNEGTVHTIRACREANGRLTYCCDSNELPEAALADTLVANHPADRLLTGRLDSPTLFALRLETLLARHQMHKQPVRGFVGARMELLPHQVFVAREVAERTHPRVLLADEVGLGKTIEACLILHRLLLTGRVRRILILVPDALVHQWFVELLRRFNLLASLFDEERCEAIESGDPGANPFLDDQLVLCGLSLLTGSHKRARQAIDAGWDLLLVDEAHHLEGTPGKPGLAYRIVEDLASCTPSLLLLTATPEQAGLESHFARLHLLDPHRYPALQPFLAEQDRYRRVVEQASVLEAAGDEAGLADLLDRYGPGRVLFRNRRASMSGFPDRHAHLIPLPNSTPDGSDARSAWLLGALREHPARKWIVITRTREEAETLHGLIRDQITPKVALFHEGLPIVQADRMAAWFAEPDGARCLVASEVGGEGRNFQFVQHLVLDDVPVDPERLEQRIGRLDRIGQTGDIHIHVPYAIGSEEEGRVRWLHEGLDAFTAPAVGGYALMQRFAHRLDQVDDDLIAETREAHRELMAKVEAGRNRLLERSSFQPDVAEDVIRAIRTVEADSALPDLLTRLLDHLGVQVDALDSGDALLHPGVNLRAGLPLGDEPLHITFDRTRAVQREDVTLMSWDHPLVDAAIEQLLADGDGQVAYARCTALDGWRLHAVFVLESIAPPGLDVFRYLPPTPVAVWIDGDGQPTAAPTTPLEPGPARELLNDTRFRRDRLPGLLAAAERLAASRRNDLVEDARRELDRVRGGEVRRLERLAEQNDHIREDERAAAREALATLDRTLAEARLRFDSLLVVRGRRPADAAG